MAWLEQHPTSGRFKVSFRYEGRKYRKTLRVTDARDAKRVVARLEETLDPVVRGRIPPPPPTCRDIAAYFLADGKPAEAPSPMGPVLLRDVIDQYLAEHSAGVQEASSLVTAKVHLAHLPKDRKSTRLNSSHTQKSRMPSSA